MRLNTTAAATELGRRRRQFRSLLRDGGVRGLTATTLAAASRRLQRPSLAFGVRDVDVLAADLDEPWSPPAVDVPASQPMVVNWVMTAPSEGSGGHTTAFRLIRHLQAQGHTCRIYLYDAFGGDFSFFREIVQRAYTDAQTEVYDVTLGMKDADAVFATSWETAYVVFNSRASGKRFYLVQDFEPSFYPAGGAAVLAENTYRMGFHAITAGRWLTQMLRSTYGMDSDSFDFGCDTDCYHLDGAERNGVVFYARPQAPRRAFELGVMGLELFARQHPEIEIHFYGNKVGKLRFPFIDHGLVSPAGLNDIYNRCFAGLSLSMTNVSLVPHEMLAAGCIPLVNDAEHNRIVLDNDFVRYVAPTPHALARGLDELVTTPDFADLARQAAASVHSASWDAAGRAVEQVLRRELSP
jgi:hypothetical protein